MKEALTKELGGINPSLISPEGSVGDLGLIKESTRNDRDIASMDNIL